MIVISSLNGVLATWYADISYAIMTFALDSVSRAAKVAICAANKCRIDLCNYLDTN